MARLDGTRAWGLDATEVELDQAARVFAGQPGLTFVHGDALAIEPPVGNADVIVLAAAIQYFPDLPLAVRRLLSWLADDGELHILDSPLYAPSEVPAARARTRAYYAGLGVPEMAGAYHHHTRPSLAPFHPDCLYRPDAWSARARQVLRLPVPPFPWLRIRRAANP
jgi:SAM-dependent methyltransferase